MLNNSRTRSEKIAAQVAYTEANKMVKKNIRTDKIAWQSRQRKQLTTATCKLSTPIQTKLFGIFNKPDIHIKDKNDASIVTEGQRKRWGEYFKELLNRPAAKDPVE